jgi:hypothetical protein
VVPAVVFVVSVVEKPVVDLVNAWQLSQLSGADHRFPLLQQQQQVCQ